MKALSTSFFTDISKAYLMRLTEEVKETIAVVEFEQKTKMLSVADVWNIQRKKRTRTQRRFTF